MTSKFSLKSLAVVVFSFALAIRLYVLLHGNLVMDDFFITLRVAKNFALGNGLVYNLNEFIYPVTSIPYTLLCSIFIFLFGEEAIFAIRLFGGIIDSLTAVLLFLLIINILKSEKFSSDDHAMPVGLFGALSYGAISTAALNSVQGMETSLYVFFIALSFYTYLNNKQRTAMVMAALTAMVRPEGILVFLSILLFELITTKKIKLKYTLFFVIPISFYLFALYLYFGTIIPQPLIAKSHIEYSFYEEWSIFLDKFFISPKSFLLGLLFLIGSYHIIRKRTALAILIWGVIYVVSFSNFTKWWAWYFPPFVLAYLFTVSIGVNQIYNWLKNKKAVLTLEILSCLIFPIVLCIYSILKSNENAKYVAPYFRQTAELAVWLENNLSRQDKVLLEPIGLIGYKAFNISFADYPGLISRNVTDAISKLNRKIHGSPVDVVAAKMVINEVKPAALVLREYEFNLLSDNNIIDGYKLEYISYIDTTEIRKNFITQDMFILKKFSDK